MVNTCFHADGHGGTVNGNRDFFHQVTAAFPGNNTRPSRIMNPLRQAHRFDPAGDYVRRYVPELAAHSRTSIHTPWPLDSGLAYPGPLVELS